MDQQSEGQALAIQGHPHIHAGRKALFQSLIREYLFVSLFRAFAESLASENASRLASMQVAEKNIEDRLRALTTESRQLRQMTITSELLDIIASFEALEEKRKNAPPSHKRRRPAVPNSANLWAKSARGHAHSRFGGQCTKMPSSALMTSSCDSSGRDPSS